MSDFIPLLFCIAPIASYVSFETQQEFDFNQSHFLHDSSVFSNLLDCSPAAHNALMQEDFSQEIFH